MLNYIMLGTNDMAASERFYNALLAPMGYEKAVFPTSLRFARPGHPTVYITLPYDGQPATAGNGSMNAFSVESHDKVRQLHAAGMAAGGSNEGAPGFRAEYSANFFVAYLRDPLGNKLALFCNTQP